MGIANMAFVIPSQTLFQERTPRELMGRVVSFRFALVFGGMSIAMAMAASDQRVRARAGDHGRGLISIAAGLGGSRCSALREA